MSYQFFKSAHLVNIENLPEGVTPPPGGQWVKSNVSNVNDGGVVLRLIFNNNNEHKSIMFTSGSITSQNITSQQISQFVSQISASNSPFVPITEEEFNTKLAEYNSYFSSL